MMRFFTAHVRNGRLLLEELTEHPDGTLVELVPTDSVMWLVPLVEVPPPDDEPADESAASSSMQPLRDGLIAGDVLVSRVFATLEGVGQPALVPEPPEPAVYESNMMRLRVNRAVIMPYLLFRWLRSDPVRRLIGARANSSNQASINQRALNTLPIGVPTFPEQQRIAEVLAAADCRIREEGRALEKHRLLKQGLMERITRCSASTPM
jgi:type I restriction enzyme S subunit